MLKAKKISRWKSDPVRVAAFCLSNLKRAQVLDTDISKAVDKILKEEMDVESYRVLGYLLLGIIRIFSKKVEYALQDCNKVLINVTKFVASEQNCDLVETLRVSVTIPDRLELDAFELDELEEADRSHTAPPDQITLKEKEIACTNEGFSIGLFSEKFEEFDEGENTSSFDEVGNDLLSKLLNMDIEVSPQNSPTDLAESWDKFQRSMFSQTEPMNIDSVIIVTGLEKESINLSGQGQRIIEDIELCEDEIHEEISRISLGESLHISLFSGRQKEHVLSVEVVEAVNDESHQVDADQSSAKETTSTALCKMMNQETIEVHEARSSRGSIEQPPEEKECVCHGSSSVPNEIHEEFIEGSVEKHDNDNEGKSGFQEKVSLEDERLRVIQPKSRNLDATPPQSLSVIPSKSKNHDATPQSKFQGDLVGKPKQDSTTPESMLIATPAVTEHPPFSRKRRDAIDRMIVLHSKVIKKSLSDTKKLVRLPKESRRTLLAAHCVKRQRESPIYSLPNRFYEPLLPCYSSELQLLLSKEKMKIPNSLKIVETSENLDVSKSPTSGAPLSPSQSSDTLEVGETPMMLVVPESPASGIPKHNATVSQTPPLCPHDTIEIESLERNEVPNLIDEETDSCGANDSELLAGWSGRTRKVASCLHKSFLHASKQREQDKVKFSQAFGGQARKAAARLFYEVLVLKTSGYVDVEQNEAYGDIAMSKLPKLDQTF